MARRLELTLACGDYEIVRALKEGIVRPEGIELTVLTDMAPSPRHWRFLRGREFDLGDFRTSHGWQTIAADSRAAKRPDASKARFPRGSSPSVAPVNE